MGLFIVFTLEVIARIIVSGFIANAAEYSTIDRQRGARAAVVDKYRSIFAPQRTSSVRRAQTSSSEEANTQRPIVNTFAQMQAMTSTVEQAQRLQLARRAFLRHSFNRLDFVAVVAYWAAFILSIFGVEDGRHLYIFRMLSCLRILRLLALTNGTAIILRSLKKATPLLLNVSFLIGFFWLLFAIIGIQSFKGSLDRQCVWIDPDDIQNENNTAFVNSQYCGGQFNKDTSSHDPWMRSTSSNPFYPLVPGASSSKGYLCPEGSYCIQLPPSQLPYNGTVTFDNIGQSLELVFVIMTGNTFTDLMYYTTDSDYLAAAIFFAGGIVIMMFWLMNLLIAVITSSFQVIRGEGKASAFAAQTDDDHRDQNSTMPRPVGKLKKMYEKTYWLWVIIIMYDIVAQGFRSSEMSESRERFIDISELVVTFLLLIDIGLRFISDWRDFHKHKRNLFDLGLAIITTVILLPPIRNSGQPYAWLTAFQILRIYRVVMGFEITRSLIILVLGNASGIGNLVLFVFLITFLVAIFAVQLFRGEIPEYYDSGDAIQVNFSTIFNSFLGLYQILSSENWTTLLYDVTGLDKTRNTSWIGASFFIGWFILANFILVNMFIAVIQENFDVSEDEKRMQQVKAFLTRKEVDVSSSNLALSSIVRFGRSKAKKDPLDYGPATMEMLLKDAVVKDFLDDEIVPGQHEHHSENTAADAVGVKPGFLSSVWGNFVSKLWNREPNPFYSNISFSLKSDDSKGTRAMAKEAVSANTFHSVILVGGFKVLSAAFVSMSLLIPFAIYGVNLFNGQLEACNDGDINNLTDCSGEYYNAPFSSDWNIVSPRQVSNPWYDFDNFGGSLFILFQIVSQEGWVDVMFDSMSITGRGLNPGDPTSSEFNAVFFVIFNLLATVFILTLFISVFMRNYTEQTGIAFLTSDQRSWVELRKLLRQVSPSKRPSTKDPRWWKDWCYKRATRKHGKWHSAMTLTLVFHLILLLVEFYPEPDWWDRTRDFIFLACTVFYSVNVVVRIIGLTWPRFRRSSWDMFSIFAVSGTLITTLLLLTNFNSQVYVQLHKLFLVAIVLLLIPRNDALDQLFKTAAASLTSIGNLLATWFVLFMVFAIAMTQTFGLTRFGEEETDNINMRTVPKTLLMLFRMSCGEGWNQIMEDYATIVPPFCTQGDSFFDSDCGSPTWARVLFIAWNIVSMYIFTSLFVSLIYESFSYVFQRSNGLSKVSRDELRRFKEAWALLDPDGTGFIEKEHFPRLLGELSGVFEMRVYSHEDSVRRILEDVQVKPASGRLNSISSPSLSSGIDLKALNERISKIDTARVRRDRARFNLFYEEVLVSADPDRGLRNFYVAVHVYRESKKKSEDELWLDFFDTMYWSRRFRKHMERKRSGRMTDIPQLGPEVYVDDEEEASSKKQKASASTSGALLSPIDITDNRNSFVTYGLDGAPLRQRRGTDASVNSIFPSISSAVSPTLSPHGAPGSAFSFEGVAIGKELVV
ncbi:hypothetical protein DID88_001176 [Monilinia fructigena]|uniref:Calcium-channel protein CCH1 n=1 Tax=Monilinia fructigena TaxID=38457 RepID=A0A395J333_9HELO|nr:hypothetical protein DID88_001176 [Monilinia fructigena]